jgi:hypothetical protein
MGEFGRSGAPEKSSEDICCIGRVMKQDPQIYKTESLLGCYKAYRREVTTFFRISTPHFLPRQMKCCVISQDLFIYLSIYSLIFFTKYYMVRLV